MSQKTYDLVLWGATGFTGRLVAEYLVRRRSGATWALGGRDPRKLEALRAELAAIDPAAATLPVLLGDSHDRPSLDAMIRSARVVCATAGPFSRYGRELVAACVAGGADYCDITGEVQFIRDMIDQHHARAREQGVRIVHACGFDSIPSDLGVFMLHDHARRERSARLLSARLLVGEARGGFSGGTLASMMNVVEEMKREPRLRRLLADPYALCPEGGPDGPDQRGLGRDPDLGTWTGPFIMAGVNTRVVRRTNHLLGYPYGRDFRYAEVMSFPRGPRGLLLGAAITAGLSVFALAASSPLRGAIGRLMPQPGEGPGPEERRNGYFRLQLVGETEPGGRISGRVEGRGDPGYAATARMVAEAALCLAEVKGQGGVLTPAAALGPELLPRLRAAGMTFQVD